jgi:hypothetical protein
MNHDLFVLACIQLLGIESNIEIRMRPRARGAYKELAGCIETRLRKGKIIGFVIFVNMDVCVGAEFSINDVIAHELVHAIMIENDIHSNAYHHNSKFQNICTELEKEMVKAGFEIGKLYSPDSDTD